LKGIAILKNPKPSLDIDNLALSNRICTTLSGAATLAENWGFYLFNFAFDFETELRNRISSIWISSLLDNLDSGKQSIEECLVVVKKRNFFRAEEFLNLAEELNQAIGELLQNFNREEQYFIQDFRNQLVHGHLRGMTENIKKWKYFNGQEIISEKLTPRQFGDLTRQFYVLGVDAGFSPIRQRFINKDQRYWNMLDVVREAARQAMTVIPQEIVPEVFSN